MTTLVQLKHGYDQAGNRLFRRDEVARTNSASFDELYGYDSLNRLTSFNRGVLDTGNTSLSSGPTLNQGWTLEPDFTSYSGRRIQVGVPLHRQRTLDPDSHS